MRQRGTEDWGDWRWQVRHAVTEMSPELRAYGLSAQACERVHRCYPLKLTPYVLAQLSRDNPDDPLNRLALPSRGELVSEPGMVADPFSEKGRAACCYGLKQRFPDRVLVMAHDQCAMACRHCTRKGLLTGAEVVRTSGQRAAAVAWVKAHPEVREVVLSGGDPLLLSDVRILALVRAFARLPQIDAVRIGTRVPVALPMRITPELAAELGAFKNVWVNTQFNHAREITSEAATACARLVDAGIPVSNQSVLLKGVNDSVGALFDLCTGLQRVRVRPYYVFMCDPVAGIAHFRVPLRQARRLERELAVRVGGLALPRFVMDIPGSLRKIPI
ncbi:MAG: KamA family radical SAM protein [bacterium]